MSKENNTNNFNNNGDVIQNNYYVSNTNIPVSPINTKDNKKNTVMNDNTKKVIKQSFIQTIVQFITEHTLKFFLKILLISPSSLLIGLWINVSILTDISVKTFYMQDLSNMTYDNAILCLNSHDLKINCKKKNIYSEIKKENKVIKQSIKAGTALTTNNTYNITLTVGKGQPTVPSCVNKELKNAKRTLKKVNLNYKIKSAYSNSVKKGRIIKQSISGKKVDPKTVITLTVSRGRLPSTPAPAPTPAPPAPKTSPTKKPLPTLKSLKPPDETLQPLPLD